ncbi:MAG TPA: BatD family protein, partial [Verrucomicrobiae bacterium]|nr:BatD family protein [Verrucomicrobiae bacterium]
MKICIHFIFLLCVCASSFAAVSATLERDTIVVGDSVTLQIQIQDATPQSQPVFQPQPNLSIEYTGAGRQFTIVNGRSTALVTLGFTITATQPGAYTIPSITVQTDAGNFTTQPLRLNVTKDDAAAAAGNSPAFLRLNVTKTNIYVGEMIPIEIKVYGLLIDELQVPVLKSEGFVIGVQAQGVRSREQVGNNIYNVYTFPTSISPAKAGALTLGPAEAVMLIRVPLQNRRRGDIFEEMLGSFQRKQITARSDTVAINVMPLPTQNRPQNFSGAVGNFQIQATAAPTNVSVGDPITLSIQIQGRGSLDSLKLPDFGWKDFTFYQPNTSVTNADRLGLQGTKYFDQVVIPQRAGIAAIPAIAFSFFDPEARAYKTVTRPAIPITVKATGHGQAQPTVVATPGAEDQKQTPATDIVHIKPSLGQ